jgi:hypothetical protein
MNKTIAQQLNIKDFPFVIKDKSGNQIYFEDSDGYWDKCEYDSEGNEYGTKILLDIGINGNTIPKAMKYTTKILEVR